MVRFGFQKTPRGRRQPGGDEQEAEGPSGLPWAKLLAGAGGEEGESCASGSISTQATRRCPQPSSSSPRQNSSIPPPADFFFGPFSFDFLTRESLLLFEGRTRSLDRKPCQEACPAPSTVAVAVDFPRNRLPDLNFH